MALALMGTLSAVTAQEQSESTAIVFDIPAQSMADALQAFAKQADLQILFKPESMSVLRTPGLSGRMTVQQALDALLKGTGLEHVRNGDVVVVRTPNGNPGTPAASENLRSETSGLAIAQVSGADEGRAEAQVSADASGREEEATSEDDATLLGETVVTGTLIRGATPASPVVVIGRTEIERGGYRTVQEIIDRLPQNYGGGENESTQSSPGGSFLNLGFGSSANLHGLGSDATLTLLNGQRLAPAGYGQFVDLSLIPLSAIERIEVVADGASATYGSDAVGGVINVILRDDYEGAETLLRGGAVTSGHLEEYQLSQTLGADWARGDALVTYEYFKRSNLDANDRDFAERVNDPFDLLPEQERHSFVASGELEITDAVALRGSALFSERDAERWAFNPVGGAPNLNTSSTRQLNTLVGATVDFADAWQADVVGLFSESRLDVDAGTPGLLASSVRNEMTVASIDATVRGLHLALGATYRDEDFADREEGGVRIGRQVAAVFAEYNLSVQRFDLSLAARYEDYSDFGNTTNPKVGLSWTPIPALKLRGTYGSSFRAPLLSELDDSNVGTLLLNFPDPAAADGTTLTMLVSGNNADLQPEEATTWTAGIDVEPPSLPTFSLSLTYFDTEFEDRIEGPLPGLQILGVYAQADVYAPIITRDPDPAAVAAHAANPFFLNLFGPFAPEDVEAIVDRRLQNISVTDVSGLDLAVEYGIASTFGDWSLGLSASYLLDFANAITETAPADDVLSTAYHPIDLKARGSVTWTRNAWGVSVFVNFVDGFTNDTVAPPEPVGSWTTADVHVSYTIPADVPALGNTRISLNVLNLLDEDPPFMLSPVATFDVGYDPTNASPLGRFISLGVVKSW